MWYLITDWSYKCLFCILFYVPGAALCFWTLIVNSKHIYKDVCGTTLVLKLMSWGQESSLSCLLGTRRGQRPLALIPYTVPRQTFGLEMSVCAGHMGRRCILRVQLKGKEAELRDFLYPSLVALLLHGRAALGRRRRSVSPAKQKSITEQPILQLNESNSPRQGKLS